MDNRELPLSHRSPDMCQANVREGMARPNDSISCINYR